MVNCHGLPTVFNLLSLADIKDVNLSSSEEINRSSTLKKIESTLKSMYEKDSLKEFTTLNDIITYIQS